MSILVSVIISVFNDSKTLGLTLDSVLRQTYKNLEIIIIDDGSTDNSLELCNSYAKRDERISVYHQKNKGISGARNTGLRHAHGKFVAFFDAGDYIENDLFESLLPYMEKNIHFIDFPYFVQTNYDCRYPVINKCEKNKVFSKDYIDKEILPIYLNIRENMNNLALNFVWRIIYLKK